MARRSPVLIVALALAALPPGVPAQDSLAADAASMQRKLELIAVRGALPSQTRAAVVRTSFTDRELNAYLKVAGPEIMPHGVASPEVAIDAGGRVRARSLVDLNAVRAAKTRDWSDPLAYVTGSVEVGVTGVLRAADGLGTLTIESATLGGVPVPVSLLQELVTHYSRSPERPEGFDLSRPFELPANINAIETAPGSATVAQHAAATP